MSTTTSLPQTSYAHICFDEQGRPRIDNTGFKVIMLIQAYLSGYSPAEMYQAYNGPLSMAQIHAALAYYYDHKDQIDAKIKSDDEEVERMRVEAEKSPQYQAMLAKLRAYKQQ